FGTGGRSAAIDRSTGRPIDEPVMREGSVDATALLGLTRETAVSTIFVRQADVLRLLADAGELQEYLERAAASSALDTTADEALARIAGYKRDHIGLLRSGSRGPLALASRRVTEARTVLDTAELRYEGYEDLLSRKYTSERELRAAQAELSEVIHN